MSVLDPHAPQNAPSNAPLVLGIVGGIGAGKSAVARVLATMGYVVLDSDTAAKALLNRPDVQRTLTQWWGDSVIDAQRTTDRKAIADIIFRDASQRQRLESLIHPMLKDDRQHIIRQVRAGTYLLPNTATQQPHPAAGAVIDAPLLFEAHVDRECDAVLFVDCPFHTRLARVQHSRGWTEAELTRRENAQMPLADKRARSHAIIQNDSDESALPARVAAAIQAIRAQLHSRRANLTPPSP